MADREVVFPEQRFGGLKHHRWRGAEGLEVATAALADDIIAAGAEVYNYRDKLVTLDKDGVVAPLDAARLRQIIGEVVGQKTMLRRNDGRRTTWHPRGEPYRFPPNANIANQPNEAVLIQLFEKELLPRAVKLEE